MQNFVITLFIFFFTVIFRIIGHLLHTVVSAGNDLEESRAVSWLPDVCLWDLGTSEQRKYLEAGKEVQLESS